MEKSAPSRSGTSSYAGSGRAAGNPRRREYPPARRAQHLSRLAPHHDDCGETSLHRCILGGEPKPNVLLWPNTIWRGSDNHLDLASLRVDKTSFTSKTFADFQKLTASENGSKWEPLTNAPADIGADEPSLKTLRME